MKRTYRAGIIGLGFIGAADQVSGDMIGQNVEDLDGTHFDAYNNNTRIEIVAGSSRNKGRRERFARRFEHGNEVAIYSDWKEMLRAAPPDIVSVATYTPVHAEITIACAEAGVRVIYCEKPIASTIIEAERMLDACRSAGSLLVINHNRRFKPQFRHLRTLISDGALGTLTSITTRWGGGRLGNVGTHIFDAVQMISGQTPVAVSGTLDTSMRPDCRGSEFHDAGGWGLIRLASGCMVTVDAADYAACPLRIEIQGTDGSADINGPEITVRRSGGEAFALETPDAGLSSMDIAVAEIVEWLDSRARGISEPAFPYDAAMALRTLETIVAFHASDARSGAWVDLPLTGDDREIAVHSG